MVNQTSEMSGVQKQNKVYECSKSLDCSECGIIFSTEGQLILHNEEHYKVRQFKCDECDSVFVTTQELEYHMKSVHVNVTEAFSKKYMLVRHKLTNHNAKYIKETSEVVELCDICNESLTSSKDKVEHYKKEHCDKDDIEVVETT